MRGTRRVPEGSHRIRRISNASDYIQVVLIRIINQWKSHVKTVGFKVYKLTVFAGIPIQIEGKKVNYTL
jgi:hypothetical protein